MFIVVSKYLIPKGYSGFTIFPFVFLKNKESQKDLVLLNQEKIHIQQQMELLILPFFLCYFIEFLIHYLKCRNWKTAYHSISFEREAYENEENLSYLATRKPYSFAKYLI
jgi:hypothetical protein